MKVYTITCHDVYNHGASLQAYALMKYISDHGMDVEIIDYKPPYLSNHYNLLAIDNPKWEKHFLTKVIYLFLKLPSRIKERQRKRAFDYFTVKYLKLTEERFYSNKELKEKLPQADVYICGSDQIWNSLYENGKDPAFYLDFAPENKQKAAYAASFATDDLPFHTNSFVKEKVNYLNKVSVREKSGLEILKRIDIEYGTEVVDPTLLLNKEEWNKLGKRRFTDKYILIYDFETSPLIKKLAIELSKKLNLKIYSINPGNFNYVDKHFKFVGPESFVSLVRDATYVISNSFHAAVFSVIYQKNFTIVNRRESINTRMRDFLDELGLNHRLIQDNYNIENLISPIHYQEIEPILVKKIAYSKHFLHDILNVENKMRDIL